MAGMRIVKQMKMDGPPHIMYAAINEWTSRVACGMPIYEGIFDNVISIPAGCETTECLIEFLSRRLSNLDFDRIILGCLFDVDIDKLAESLGWNNSSYYSAAFHDYYKEVIGNRLLQELPRESAEYYRAYSIEESILPLVSTLDKNKHNISIHPLSTRKYGAIYPEAMEIIVDALYEKYNVIVLGTEFQLYSNNLYGGIYNSSPHDINAIRKSKFIEKCYDWIGLSPLKQLSIMKRCNYNIISTTGAHVWSYLYDLPMIVINGGEWECMYYEQFCRSLSHIDCLCERFPCKDDTRMSKCKDVPICYASGINIDGLMNYIGGIGI